MAWLGLHHPFGLLRRPPHNPGNAADTQVYESHIARSHCFLGHGGIGAVASPEMADRRTSRSGRKVRPAESTGEQVRRYVTRALDAREAQGLPRHVADPATLAEVQRALAEGRETRFRVLGELMPSRSARTPETGQTALPA
jgi:hypothetical protein